MQIEPYLWNDAHQGVQMMMPHYDQRVQVDFKPNKGELQANNTILETSGDDLTMGMNVVYNDTETRLMHFIVNGRDGSNKMDITGHRCIEHCDMPDPDDDDEEKAPLGLWSNPATWTNLPNRIPQEGDDVIIEKQMQIVYDIGESPVFKSIMIEGDLSFQRGMPHLLQSYAIWIRDGETTIGTEEEPFDSTVEIRLHGNNQSPSQINLAPQIPGGAKNLVITGSLKMFGTPRERMTRLIRDAYPGEDFIMVKTGMDLRHGDYLGLPATNTDPHQSETVIVESYDSQSGQVMLVNPLKGYHFGAADSTADDYSGIDMRGEVLVLSSNVNVTASTDENSKTYAYPEPYGCQILVADFFEPFDLSYKSGSIHFDNVAIFNCSQEKTEYAFRFDYAVQNNKTVTNSAISSGKGEGIIMKHSKNIVLDGNVVHDFILYGIKAEKSSFITLNNNIVNGVRPFNEEFPAYTKWDEPNGGIEMSDSKDFLITNNVVASTWSQGYRLPSYACGGSQVNTGNIAHSIAGYGVIVH
jgi:hypothetical protein